MDYDAPLDLSAANEDELDLCRKDMIANGIPPTPARWQRKFKWSYHKAQSAMMQLDTLGMSLSGSEIPCEHFSGKF